jgi:hypothetical protein
MYDKLIQNYRVFFEGAIAPVFYKGFYPKGNEGGNREHKLLHDYARGLKSEWPSDERHFADYAQEYERDLHALLNCFVEDTKGLRRGVVVIPSSTEGETNRVTELVRKVIDERYASTVTDLTQCLLRTQSKAKAHSGGTRSAIENMNTLSVNPSCRVQDYSAILVLDDITTTGNSFVAVDIKLQDAGFRGQIINFAFARTCPSEGIDLYGKWEVRHGAARVMTYGELTSGRNACFSGFSEPFYETEARKVASGAVRSGRGIDGIVFDFDETLVSDERRDLEYEEYLRGDASLNGRKGSVIPCPYELYPGVRRFMSLGIPFAIVSNRPIRALSRMVDDPAIYDFIYPGRIERDGEILGEWLYSGERFYPLELVKGSGTAKNQRENLFSPPKKKVNGRDCYLYKPCPHAVLQAIQLIRSTNGLGDDARIIGIGNTPEDIIAYKEAGIESALALWGVRDYLLEHAEHCWGADYCFRSMREFELWCRAR